MNFRTIYELSPIWCQNLLISLYGFKLKKQRYGKNYNEKFEYYFNKRHESEEKEEQEQADKLISFIIFAVKNSLFYKKKYKDIDITQIKCIEDLSLLPIITKEELRKNILDIYTVSKAEGVAAFTGGTTGKALEVVFTKDDFQERMAYLDAFKATLGIDPFKTSKATFSGREILPKSKTNITVFWRNNHAYNQRLYSTFHMNEQTLPLYIENLNKLKPQVVNGFVSAIYDIAKFIESNGIKLEFCPKAIFTTSETLLPFHRKLIEKVFGAKIYNQYASAEGAPFITECSLGELHYNLDTGVIEVSSDKGSILVTSFTTHGTPLIRYDIGDEVTFKEGVCNCGSKHPLVKEVKGRMVDFLLAPNGNKVSLSHLADVIKGMPSCISKVQFNQINMDTIVINIVVDIGNYNAEYDQLIIESMRYRFGSDINIEIQKVSSIEREKSGKYSLIKNEMNKK
jgi:phenylacetate-CoA ligase